VLCAASLHGSPLDVAEQISVPLGDNRFVLEWYGTKDTPRVLFLIPHQNEAVGFRAALPLVTEWARYDRVALCRMRPQNHLVDEALAADGVAKNDPPERYLYFRLRGRYYCVDPNRIFTPAGVARETMAWDGKSWVKGKDRSIPSDAVETVGRCSSKLLDILGLVAGAARRPDAVVAVHNNTPSAPGDPETFSLLWYKEGGPCAGEVKAGGLVEGDPQSIDNLFLVTEERDFDRIKAHGGFNAVLLDKVPEGSRNDDGSMSVLCGARGVRYINIEAQHGNVKAEMDDRSCEYQVRMLQLARTMLTVRKGVKR
jgi:hypothetical protein